MDGMDRRLHPAMGHPTRSRRMSRLVIGAGIALLATPALPALRASADVGGISYPGGCTVSAEVTTINNTCTFNNLASDPEQVIYQGPGTVTITTVANGDSSCVASSWSVSNPNIDSPVFAVAANELGGCEYQAQVSGGAVVIYDNNPFGLGACAEVALSNPTSDSCNYVALAPAGLSGRAIAAVFAANTNNVSYRVDVIDETTTTFVTVASCPAIGFLVSPITCTYPEKVGHIYYDNVTMTSGSATAIVVLGVG